jgi:predicted transcriptional regulator YdeE
MEKANGEIMKTNNSLYIYGTWLPNTNYELADSPELERYDSRWLSGDKPEMELWIPIK